MVALLVNRWLIARGRGHAVIRVLARESSEKDPLIHRLGKWAEHQLEQLLTSQGFSSIRAMQEPSSLFRLTARDRGAPKRESERQHH